MQKSIFELLEIQEQINEEEKIIFTYADQLQKIKDLVNHLKMKYQSVVHYIEVEEFLYLITFPLEVHSSLCILQFEILLNFKELQTNFRVLLFDQNGRILVNEKNIRIQLCRYMLRLNSNLRVGSFFVHPLDGYIGLKLQCYNGKENQIYMTDKDFEEFTQYLDSLVQTAIYSLRFHFLRILILINRINIMEIDIYDKYQENENKNWRKFPPDIITLLKRINNTIETNLNEPFTKEQYQQYGPIIQKQILSDNKIINQIKVNSPNDLHLDVAHEINSGGFSIIYGKDISFTIEKNNQQNNLKRHFAIKADKNPESQKIKREIQILQILTNDKYQIKKKNQKEGQEYFKFTGTCPYISQYYYIQERDDILLMERYFYSSLDSFHKKMEDCLSLSSKIFIAHSIAMGLRYCHQYDIIHMDIKPANILISKSLIAKITDFGEAIHNNGKEQFQSVGKTLPYCAPEMQRNPSDKSEFTSAYDIFSFGFLLFELLFDRQPIDFRRQNIRMLEEKYLRSNYTVRYNEKYEKKLGPQKLMKYLGRLCLLCLQPDPKLRPNIDKIVLILKDSLSYLDRMY
ncbi:unnamed protein product [Paramecium pentaurelia]|uniref:Protein kinase domain-containing protein n=1 Tax=Paramecium pentaurelia TaxID=43138 RepID=A0A8S1W4N8_9CILI|nr:unnamed protein product [Paramecium pentaurelia]